MARNRGGFSSISRGTRPLENSSNAHLYIKLIIAQDRGGSEKECGEGEGGGQRVSEQSPAFCFIKIIDPAASSRVEKKDDREIFPRSGRIFFLHPSGAGGEIS